MEIDPLKIPAFMRKKGIPRGGGSQYYKPSDMSAPAKPPRAKPVFSATVPMPIKPKPIKKEAVLLPAGVVTHYYDKIDVAIIKLGIDLQTGVKLQLTGMSGVFKQKLKSMQIDRKPVEQASRGAEIGVKVNKKAVVGELVYVVGK